MAWSTKAMCPKDTILIEQTDLDLHSLLWLLIQQILKQQSDMDLNEWGLDIYSSIDINKNIKNWDRKWMILSTSLTASNILVIQGVTFDLIWDSLSQNYFNDKYLIQLPLAILNTPVAQTDKK